MGRVDTGGMSVLRLQGFPHCALALRASEPPTAVKPWRAEAVRPCRRVPRPHKSTRPRPSSSSPGDKAVVLWGKCKKQFNRCLHSQPTGRSCAGTEPETEPATTLCPTPTRPPHPWDQDSRPASCRLPGFSGSTVGPHPGNPQSRAG